LNPFPKREANWGVERNQRKMNLQLFQRDIKDEEGGRVTGSECCPWEVEGAATQGLTELDGVVLGARGEEEEVRDLRVKGRTAGTYMSPYFQMPMCCLRADCSASLYSPTCGRDWELRASSKTVRHQQLTIFA
jgi:hypothetical protein